MACTQHRIRPSLSIAVLLPAFLLVGLTPAPVLSHWDYYAIMSGEEMVPPTSSPGGGGFHGTFDGHAGCPGSGVFHIAVGAGMLEGTPNGVSLWIGQSGTIGELLVRVPGSVGDVEFSPEHCEHLVNGNMYAVLETDAYPAGEIRGEVFEEVSHPVEPGTWGLIKQTFR